jgi:membrane protein YdbS with pleckstrin-like domain
VTIGAVSEKSGLCMIPLNTRQGLPIAAFWYMALRSLCVAVFLVILGRLFQIMPAGSCRGPLCPAIYSGLISILFYASAAQLVVNAVLRFKYFWFVLTDKSISINSGILMRRSCTIRFDRIQDVDTFRGPLHMMFGLTSVAIWTASLDQRAGRVNRPDGLIVLDSATADWLREYLSDPAPASGAPRAGGEQVIANAPGGLVILMIAALPVVGLIGFWRLSSPNSSAADTGAPAPPAATSAASHPHVVRPALAPKPTRLAAANPAAPTNPAGPTMTNPPAQYGLSCTIRKSLDGMKQCGELKQAGRCEHEADFRSRPTDEPAVLTVVNRSDETVKFYWLDRSGSRALYATLSPGGHVNQPSHIGAHWLVSTQDEHCIGIFSAETMAVGIF